jgi:hypothetical protein
MSAVIVFSGLALWLVIVTAVFGLAFSEIRSYSEER